MWFEFVFVFCIVAWFLGFVFIELLVIWCYLVVRKCLLLLCFLVSNHWLLLWTFNLVGSVLIDDLVFMWWFVLLVVSLLRVTCCLILFDFCFGCFVLICLLITLDGLNICLVVLCLGFVGVISAESFVLFYFTALYCFTEMLWIDCFVGFVECCLLLIFVCWRDIYVVIMFVYMGLG